MSTENTQPLSINSAAAFATLGQFLEEDQWFPQLLDDKRIYRVTFSGKNSQFVCFAQIRADLDQFLFYAVAPIKAPEDARVRLAELLTRANYGLRIGNFELDFNDGEIRYKASVDFEGMELSKTLIKNMVYPVVQTMDRYLPAIFKGLYNTCTPKEAVEEAEGKTDSSGADQQANEPNH